MVRNDFAIINNQMKHSYDFSGRIATTLVMCSKFEWVRPRATAHPPTHNDTGSGSINKRTVEAQKDTSSAEVTNRSQMKNDEQNPSFLMNLSMSFIRNGTTQRSQQIHLRKNNLKCVQTLTHISFNHQTALLTRAQPSFQKYRGVTGKRFDHRGSSSVKGEGCQQSGNLFGIVTKHCT
ncbi:hypothetical protein F2P81_000352 [Scophthalmus maximus]|uniref:Uncharacterized protein n=1 Tax=Scophthalmus maximus TaxID=52904 RepID=A0A6A4TPC6_SCOMX|nr:hypothetical protein F2P81_000352 [Scophthalmus maximus]